MKRFQNARLRSLLFAAGGALAGYLYYALVGCATGTCPIASNPFASMAYLGLVGWLISHLFDPKEKT